MAPGTKPSAAHCSRDLGHGRGIGHRAQRIGDAVGHDVGLAALGLQPVGKVADGAVAIAVPRHVVQGGAEQAVEQRIAGAAVLGRGRRQPAVIDGEMAVEPELRRRGRDLALAVGLHDAARDQRVDARAQRLVQHVVELAQLVAAEAGAGAVLALDPEARAAEVRGEPRHRLERRRQRAEADPAEARQRVVQAANGVAAHGGQARKARACAAMSVARSQLMQKRPPGTISSLACGHFDCISARCLP